MKMTKKKIIVCLMLLPAVLYTGICAYLYFFQRNILYIPDKLYAAPSKETLPDMQEITVKTDDGLVLDGWYQPAQANKKTVLYFNGNKSGLSEHQYFYHALVTQGYGLLSVNYRGYGRNAGLPSEEGLYRDARAAIGFLQAQQLSMEDIIFFGRSLGSGVAVQMATEYLPYAVVLVSPYTSIAAVGKMRYPYVPVNMLLHDQFDSLSKIAHVASPLLIFHGKADTVIPVGHASALHAAAKGSQIFLYDDEGHNGLPSEKIVEEITRFIEKREMPSTGK